MMMPHRPKKSKPAFALLMLFGSLHLLIGASVLTSGCVLTLHGYFQDSPDLKSKMDVEYDYSHYWVGGFYLINAVLTWCSGCKQGRRRLTFITTLFLVLSLVISLFAIVLDGPDWVEWKNVHRTIKFRQSKTYNASCRALNYTCVCSDEEDFNLQVVSHVSDCDQVLQLTVLYGIIVSGAVIGAALCVATLLVMVNSISWKDRWKAYASYTASYVNKAAFSSLNSVMELHEKPRDPTTSSTLSLPRHSKEYIPAWSLYGSPVEELDNQAPY